MVLPRVPALHDNHDHDKHHDAGNLHRTCLSHGAGGMGSCLQELVLSRLQGMYDDHDNNSTVCPRGLLDLFWGMG